MAKHKVDADMKKKRKAQERAAAAAGRSKRTAIVFSILGAALAIWIGYAVWDTAVNYPQSEDTTATTDTVDVNLDAINDYMSGLNSN